MWQNICEYCGWWLHKSQVRILQVNEHLTDGSVITRDLRSCMYCLYVEEQKSAKREELTSN